MPFVCRQLAVFLVIGWAAANLLAQEPSPPPSSPLISANQLVRETVAREVSAANSPSQRHMFRSRRQTPKGSQTKLYVETHDAMVGMLILNNDRPLSPQQHQAEIDHLNWLAGNPEQLKKKHAREKEDADRTLRIVKAMPEAFTYKYAGTEPGTAEMGKPGDELVKLTFTPNPDYSPPSKVEESLRGMQGIVLIDITANRIAKIDGTLFRDVSFGWGIIGRLDKGGHFIVKQADVGDGSWEITNMNLKITGKILLFKGISMISDETFSDFHAVPEDLTFGKGVDLLRAEQEKLAHNAMESAAEKRGR
jgi:hypothetical protein